jgi:hypothetical protein
VISFEDTISNLTEDLILDLDLVLVLPLDDLVSSFDVSLNYNLHAFLPFTFYFYFYLFYIILIYDS